MVVDGPGLKAAQEALAKQLDDENIFQQWLDEECDVEPGNSYKTATSAALLTSWGTYAKAAGSLPGSKARFGENLKAARLEQARSTGGVRTWRGVQIRRPFSQTRDAD